MVHAPELLILDEPTNGLDPRGRRQIHDLLRAWVQGRKAAVLICTHLLDDVMRLCDRVGIIHHGRTVLEGPLWKVLADHGSGQRFRIQVQDPPDTIDPPPGVSIVGRDQGWWSLSLSGISPSQAWQHLLEKGLHIQEIHAEANGIEELYLRMTGDTVAANSGELS
jgi:ABC-2 type transport system ATP-binding protein